jgi:hypothetical protein
MKIFADFHHQALYHSLYLLFEERLGWELYRPIGLEWYNQGFWNVYKHPATAEQYLGLYQGTKLPTDIHGNVLLEGDRKNLRYTKKNEIYYIKDKGWNCIYKAIRLQQFKDMEFDIILSSIPQHTQPFNKLISLYQPKAKHIFQIGNGWSTPSDVKNIMASTSPTNIAKHTVFYHQEFNLDVFRYEPPGFQNVVNSYIHYMKKKSVMDQVGRQLPGWCFTKYGAGMDASLQGVRAVAEAIRDSSFTWQYKPGGDGFGHTIFGSYACGRPALVWRKHYVGCGADKLFEDGVTCIDTSIRSTHEIVSLLKHYSQPDIHDQMCEAAYQRFKAVVDFDAEFEKIKKFLEDLR